MTARTPRGASTPRGSSLIRDFLPRAASSIQPSRASSSSLATSRVHHHKPTTTSGNNGKAWSEYGGSGGGCSSCAFASETSRVMEHAELAIFVHFIPPPLRAEGKKDLPWIVHTCDGSGCREAKHVSFHAVTGFSTFEGAPPEVAEGLACSCQIANHHLRGYGKVRWEGDHHAIIEDETDGAGTSIDARAYMAKAKSLTARVKALQSAERQLRLKLDQSQQVCMPVDAEDIVC